MDSSSFVPGPEGSRFMAREEKDEAGMECLCVCVCWRLLFLSHNTLFVYIQFNVLE